MKTLNRSLLVAFSLLAFWRPVVADDTDLFVRAKPAGDVPNVLFVIDNAAGFEASSSFECKINNKKTALSGTVGGTEQCALYNVISELDPDSVRIGIMVYNANGVRTFQNLPCGSYEEGSGKNKVTSFPGGCLVYPIQLMNTSNKATLLAWIESWKTSGGGAGYIKANSQATGATMQEAWSYMKGRVGLSGTNYASLKPPSACDNFIIFVGNAVGSNGTPGDATGNKGPMDALINKNTLNASMNASPVATAAQQQQILSTLKTTCGKGTFTFPGGGNHENKGHYADEWARYMEENKVSTTYTIGYLGQQCQEAYEATLASMADVGGGKFFPTTDYTELVAAFEAALSEMIARNSVFASVSLPISVNTEGTYLNQVYIGMFRPDGNTLPRWMGNLKQYRLGRYPQPVCPDPDNPVPSCFDKSNPVRLVDSTEPSYKLAVDEAGSGFVSACANSFWTPTSEDNYWTNLKDPAQRNCQANKAPSNFADGPVVEKGAQGYTLRKSTVSGRKLTTCDASCSSTLASFNSANDAITKTLLGNAAMSDAERTLLIDWARGLNNRGSASAKAVDPLESADESFVADTAMRPSVHGDVVHSRPVALNFSDSDKDPEIVVFYGGNDGVLRAINGNRKNEFDGAKAGEEIWGFMAPEFYDQIKRLRDNTIPITIKGKEEDEVATPPRRIKKPYGFDGVISAYVDPDSGKKLIFATMRRGGRMVYAFDVTDINTDPDKVKLLWRFGCTDSGSCFGGLNASDIGQTWSAPKIVTTKGYSASGKLQPMVIMGGGYDTCEDADPNTCTNLSKGRKVYVIDALTGERRWDFTTERGVVADVFVVYDKPVSPETSTNRIKYAYVVDLGGNIYRISGGTADKPAPINSPDGGLDAPQWVFTKIAKLGCDDGSSTCTANRKFMYMPDVVEDSGGYVLLVGSGDREKPLKDYTAAYGVENYFFMLRDFPTKEDWLLKACGNNDYICLASLLKISGKDNPDPDALAEKKGWYLAMNEGEQVVTSAITVYGATTFSTHTPTDPPEGACNSDLGTARVYNIKYSNAAPSKKGVDRSQEVDGGGLPPSPVAGRVTLDTGEEVSFIIGASKDSSIDGSEPIPPELTTLPKSITYWFIER